MSDDFIALLNQQLRADYQLPPYFADATINRSIKRCAAELESLNPGADFEKDEVGRGLLCDFAYYDLTHRYDEFFKNYEPHILQWQLMQPVPSMEAAE